MESAEGKKTPIGDLGKFGLIDHLARKILIKNKNTILGIGDDAAVIDSGKNLTLISTDLFLEGIHFNLIYTPLKHLGYKVIIRAISDIYAMNGTPEQVLIALGISSRFSLEQVEELYEGIHLACEKYNIDVAGGDITSSLTGLSIGMTSVGSVAKGCLIKRSGARPNDLICVTGDFGASYMGLQLLERERKLFEKDKTIKPDLSGFEYSIGRQLKPDFPSNIPGDLKKAGITPSSMIDVTDGLASDLFHICKLSNTGCKIYSEKIPIDYETSKLAEEFNLDPIIPALNGGEDYELLFTVPLEMFEKIKSVRDIKVIGHMTPPSSGKYLVLSGGSEVELSAQGWRKTD